MYIGINIEKYFFIKILYCEFNLQIIVQLSFWSL